VATDQQDYEPFIPVPVPSRGCELVRRSLHFTDPGEVEAWPAIKAGNNTLIVAPTGSGKTLAAFLAAGRRQ
jgi:superfamily II DNA/RNA helicase